MKAGGAKNMKASDNLPSAEEEEDYDEEDEDSVE